MVVQWSSHQVPRSSKRQTGEVWLTSVTSAQSEKHIPDAYEIVVGEVSITTDVQVLDSKEALLLRAREGFNEGGGWMIYGPADYVHLSSYKLLKSVLSPL